MHDGGLPGRAGGAATVAIVLHRSPYHEPRLPAVLGRHALLSVLEPADRERLEGLRGEIELPIPAASAVKIGGERAYRLHRRGVTLEMPVRSSQVHELTLEAYDEGIARLDLLVSSGTYVRAIADVLGGHCRSLRRNEIGPFSVEAADSERILPVDEALSRL